MEMAVIIKRDLVSKMSGKVISKGTIAIYCDTMQAIKTGERSNKSTAWMWVKEGRDFRIIGWKRVK